MTQLLVAHMKLKMIHKLIQKFYPSVNTSTYQFVCSKGNDKDSNLLGHNAMQTGNHFLIL